MLLSLGIEGDHQTLITRCHRGVIQQRFRMLLAFSVYVVAASRTYAYGQGYATIMVKQVSSSLSGTVRAPDGEALDKVSVAICEQGFNHCSKVATTDGSGRFSLVRQKDQKTYYLQFLLDGMDPEYVTVTLKRGAGPLDVKLIVAT